MGPKVASKIPFRSPRAAENEGRGLRDGIFDATQAPRTHMVFVLSYIIGYCLKSIDVKFRQLDGKTQLFVRITSFFVKMT